ncbi:MAG: hypothetical protein ABID35_01575, partial [Candidatus Margulisiibacteriota bacterium]
MYGSALNHLSQLDASFYDRLNAAKNGDATSSAAAAYEFAAEAQNSLSTLSLVVKTAIAQMAARHTAEYVMAGQHVDQL